MKGLKKVTKLKEKEIFAAIGWLAREGKVNVASDEEGKQIEVTLLWGLSRIYYLEQDISPAPVFYTHLVPQDVW